MSSSPSHAFPSHSILTPRLHIRTAADADAGPYHALQTNPLNHPYGAPEPGLTVEILRARIARNAASTARGENAWVVIFLRETGEMIGHGGYNTFKKVDPAVFLGQSDSASRETGQGKEGEKKLMTDIGLMFDHRYWRQGYGKEALGALVEYARGELGCEVFRTETSIENEMWRGLMRKAGMEEGKVGKASFDEKKEVLVWKWVGSGVGREGKGAGN